MGHPDRASSSRAVSPVPAFFVAADFAGLGDSLGPPGKEDIISHAFADRTSDIRAMVDALEKLGFQRFTFRESAPAPTTPSTRPSPTGASAPSCWSTSRSSPCRDGRMRSPTSIIAVRRRSSTFARSPVCRVWRTLLGGQVDFSRTLHSQWVRALRSARLGTRQIGRGARAYPKTVLRAVGAVGSMRAPGQDPLPVLRRPSKTSRCSSASLPWSLTP